jgi:hypothetical protein
MGSKNQSAVGIAHGGENEEVEIEKNSETDRIL